MLKRCLLTLCIITACAACGKKEQAKREFPPVPVQIAEVIQKTTPVHVEAIGHVAALNTVDIKSRVTGELIKTHFKRGDPVSKDQQLFTIDPAPFEAKLREITAKVSQSRVLYEQSKRDFVRFQALHTEKAVSLEQLETKQVDMYSKLHQMELCQAELENAKLNLGYCFIQSPLDGESGEIFIDDYNIINANQDKLVTIKQIRPIRIKFSVPGKFLDEIRLFHSESPLEVEARPAGSEIPETGKLTLVDNNVNPKTGMIVLEATFPNPEVRLWPGQFVQVRLKLTQIKDAVLVPERAVNEGSAGQFAWLVGSDNTVAIKPLTLGRRSGALNVVSEGLRAGDKVVIDGQLLLRPGARVVFQEPTTKFSSDPEKTQPEQRPPAKADKANES